MEELTEKIDFCKDGKDYATDMPIWKLVLLYTITIGFYAPFWGYINLRMLNYTKKTNISQWLGIFVAFPIVAYFVCYKIFLLNNNRKSISHLKTIFIIVILSFFQWTGNLPDPYFALCLFTVVPFILMQLEINKYIKKTRI